MKMIGGKMEERILARLETLKEEREAYVDNANKVVFGYDSIIAELEALLKPEAPVVATPVENESV
jgi:hypothetical protein